MTDEEVALVTQMNYLDAARVIEIKLGGAKALADAVAARVSVSNYSLVCGLLAGIPVREVSFFFFWHPSKSSEVPTLFFIPGGKTFIEGKLPHLCL